MLRYCVTFLITVLAMGTFVSEALALTMEESVLFALENNHRIKEFERLEDSAREDVGVKRGAFWPSADLSYSYADVEVGGATPLGSAFNRNVSSGTAEISYNLFNGLSDLRSLQESLSRAEASMYERDAVTADVVLDARTAYIDVLRAKRAAATAREGVELLERQAEDARRFYDVGLFAKNDVLKVEVELASARQDLIAAEGDLAVARKLLERTIGVGIPEDEVVEDLEETPSAAWPPYEELSTEALAGRSELRQLRALGEAQGYGAEAIRGDYFPSVDLSFTHTRYGDNADLAGRELLNDDEDRITLSATWNVFDGFSTSHALKQARYQQEATLERLRDTREEILLQLKEALEGYEVALGRLEAAATAVEQAEENYRVTQNQFREQLATTTDLLDARFFLTRARNQHNNAVYDTHLWAARIDRAVEAPLPGEGGEEAAGPPQ
ncbi:MAG: TolC family protein [Nitrospirota bacterium]|jgi:outer membrane protein TolC